MQVEDVHFSDYLPSLITFLQKLSKISPCCSGDGSVGCAGGAGRCKGCAGAGNSSD
jgi:hypothetical protein